MTFIVSQHLVGDPNSLPFNKIEPVKATDVKYCSIKDSDLRLVQLNSTKNPFSTDLFTFLLDNKPYPNNAQASNNQITLHATSNEQVETTTGCKLIDLNT